jgi:hypothetical protein
MHILKVEYPRFSGKKSKEITHLLVWVQVAGAESPADGKSIRGRIW